MIRFLILCILVCSLFVPVMGQDANRLHELGKNYMIEGDYVNAESLLYEAYQKDTNNLVFAKDLTLCLYFQKELKKALQESIDEIKSKLHEILQSFEIIILSGGVSKGKFDLIPTVLKELGVNELFHRIKQKPGKPFWFGASASNLVFALPGNPVSTLVCCYRYVIPFLQSQLMNLKPEFEMTSIDCDYFKKGNLTYFLPVKKTVQVASPSDGNGSGDFAHLANVDGWIEIPEEINEIKKGDTFRYLPFRF